MTFMDWTDPAAVQLLGLFVEAFICFALGVIAGQQR
jgi:hypothetical protein